MIEEFVSNLPKTREGVKSAFENCSSRAKFIEAAKTEFKNHLEKAKSDLRSIENDFSTEFWNWVVVKSYYAMHHAANALLIKSGGMFSKDHICAIIALKHSELLPDDFYERIRKIHAKFSDFTAFEAAYNIRKIGQYDVVRWKEIKKADAEVFFGLAKEFIAFAEARCYE